MLPLLRTLALATTALFAAAQAVATPTTSFTVTGAVDTPRTLGRAELDALPQVTEAVTYRSGAASVSTSFTGPTIWSVLATAGLTPIPGARNSSLRDVVVATGSDGYQVVYSGGELNPMFGGSGTKPPLVATRQAGQLLGSTGFARTTAPKDLAGGRYVSNLANLNVVTAPPALAAPGGTSSSFRLGGLVAHPTTYTYANLSALPSMTETVSYTSAGRPVTATYTGVTIWSLLVAAGIITDPLVKNDSLRDYVLATGSDGYQAVFSIGELDPRFGGSGAMDLVAYAQDGVPLGSSGFARLVVPGDVAGGRYVSNLVSLQVLTVVPEPSSLAVVASAVAVVGLGLRRRRRG